MAEPDLVKTGIAGLDDVLPNGIPRGNVILVEGAIGAGKTTMGVEFVYRGASQFDQPGIIVVFEVSPTRSCVMPWASAGTCASLKNSGD